jgi:predicted transcriptional regulator
MEGNNALADDKLSILYFINCLGIPLTNGQITRFFIDNNIMNYFNLQQYIIELISGGLVNNVKASHSQFLTLTPKGKEALIFFQRRISPVLRNTIESYAEKNRSLLKNESQILADYQKIAHNQYEVLCKVVENQLVLMELKLNVPSSSQAKEICENWRVRAPEVFKSILENLVESI